MKFFAKVLCLILKIRYRIHITWLELLKGDQPQLIFPSHVALMDPVILMAYFSQKCKLHPLVTSSFFNNPFLKPLFKMIGAVPIGDFESNQGSKDDVNEVLSLLNEKLNHQESVLLYPQWALARQWFQVLNGKKTAYELTKHSSNETQILTVSIQWLWWSRSSYAWNGKSPNLFLFILKWFFFTLLNGFFFVPKRDVFIEITNQTTLLKKHSQKWINSFNCALETIYNQKWEEHLHYLSWLWYLNTVAHHQKPHKIIGSLEDLKTINSFDEQNVDPVVFSFVKQKIRTMKPDITWEISLNSNVVLDLMFDSLDIAELKSSLLAEFPKSANVPLSHLKSVGDFVMMGMGKWIQEDLKACNWNYNWDSNTVYQYLKNCVSDDSTILSVIKKTFSLAMKKHHSFCYDSLLWIQTFKDFLLKVYVIAELIKQHNPWKYVAIMLPSLSATALLITACYFAGKIPVMINWTQSEQAFDSCVKSQNTSLIFTAKSFFNTLQNPWLKHYQFVFIEDLLKDIPVFVKLRGLFKFLFFITPSNLDETAVVLFTSWSESLPKAVHLTHQNILQDLVGVLWRVDVWFHDILLWFLPPFHSFWFTITTILPLVSWMRIVFSPDPNDASTLVKLIQHTQSTFVPSTPTFLRGILQTAKENQISSLKFAVVWAEKASDETFSLFSLKCPHGKILEWYGITECSPVISVNPFQKGKIVKNGSVWLPILWLDVLIQSLETEEKVWAWKEWMIYVSGKSIFDGYVDSKLEDPFTMIDGKKYYKTGDLWYVDQDGYLFISGRLKRFVKIAWEMISLPAIEQILFEKYGDKLCVEAKELSSWKVKFVLFSVENYSLKEVNSILYDAWIPHLVEIQEVRVLEALPILWTWKTDFMSLRKMIE